MTIKERIDAFSKLGQYLKDLDEETLEELQLKAGSENPWFTPENVTSALKGIGHFLEEDILINWVENYDVKDQGRVIGVVMAGNIPLVGFHDLLCVLISGNKIKIKPSSKDSALMLFIISKLIEINKEFEEKILIADQLKEIDAIIATGSDNSSRYFEHYFSKYPNIIRKNRTSCAILDSDASKEELKPIGHDIFKYYGLGCRNISKLYVPAGYNFDTFFEAIEEFDDVKHHHKYNNNYDYNKSVYLVNKEPHLDNGFLLLKKESAMVSPISVLFYEEYENQDELKSLIESNRHKIQCIVSKNGSWPDSHKFGHAQYPKVDDYADGVDTMQFLTSL